MRMKFSLRRFRSSWKTRAIVSRDCLRILRGNGHDRGKQDHAVKNVSYPEEGKHPCADSGGCAVERGEQGCFVENERCFCCCGDAVRTDRSERKRESSYNVRGKGRLRHKSSLHGDGKINRKSVPRWERPRREQTNTVRKEGDFGIFH